MESWQDNTKRIALGKMRFSNMERYRVFVSSIMNATIEDLLAEREAARAAIEHFAPITTAWAFEAEPASTKPLLDFYIDGVKSSDLFVLIVGQRLTQPVKAEFDTARDHGKPMLAFAKIVDRREVDANQLLHSANVKYDVFSNPTELRDKLRRALGEHLLHLIRGNGDEMLKPGDRLARLRAYARTGVLVKVLPLIPVPEYTDFRVKSVDGDIVFLEKDSNRESITVPAHRIEDVMHAEPPARPTVLLNGRLQWITIPGIWRFFPQKPLPSDLYGLGFGKERPRDNPGVPIQCGWVLQARLAARLGEGYAVFYDEDGKHICSAGQVLVIRQ
jgi:hypothetical protein